MDPKSIPGGGPAFPVLADQAMQNDAWGGMTLRDYFAGQVAAGDQIGSPLTRAKWAYEVADAMLIARSAS